MPLKAKRVIEDLVLNKLNSLNIWCYLNLGNSSFKLASKLIDLLVYLLYKLSLINILKK